MKNHTNNEEIKNFIALRDIFIPLQQFPVTDTRTTYRPY